MAKAGHPSGEGYERRAQEQYAPPSANVSSDLAERYGYSDALTSGVSALDVLVKAHEIPFRAAFTKSTAQDFLKVSSTGFATTICGIETADFGFATDGAYPLIRTALMAHTAMRATASHRLRRQISLWWNNFSSTRTAGTWTILHGLSRTARVDSISAAAGEDITLNLQGFIYMFGSHTKEYLITMRSWGTIEDAQLTLVNIETGEMMTDITDISGAVTDEDGKGTLCFDEPGTYYVSAYCDHDETYAYITSPWLKVIVTETSTTDPGGEAFSGLEFGRDGTGENLYEMIPAFDLDTTEYTVVVPEYYRRLLF